MSSLTDLVSILVDTPSSKIILIAGVACILLGAIREWKGKWDVGPRGRWVVVGLGVVMVVGSVATSVVRAPKLNSDPGGRSKIVLPTLSPDQSVEVMVGGAPATGVRVLDGAVVFDRDSAAAGKRVTLRIDGEERAVLGRM